MNRKDTYQHHVDLLSSVRGVMSVEGTAYVSFVHRPCEGHTVDRDLEFFLRAEKVCV